MNIFLRVFFTDPCPLTYIMLALCIAGLILIIAVIALMRNRG